MAGVGIIVNRSHGVQQCSRRRGKNQARAGAARRSVRVRSCVKSVPSRRVLVTGAGGRTGRLVLEKLARRDNGIEAVGFVRSLEKADELLKLVGDTEIFVGDITEMASMEKAFKDADALVILTSAVPHMISPGPPPKFSFNEMMMPERVDWQGQKAQIDLAKAGKLKHVVLVGSRGGTDENHMLNKIGDGNILIWKRKSEQYLVDSGVNYTIVRAGGLLDQPGGERELVVGKDDEKLMGSDGTEWRSLPRADVAEMCVRAIELALSGATAPLNKSMDLVSKPVDEEGAIPTTTDEQFIALLESATAGM